MRRFFIQKNNLLALLSIVLLSIASLVYLFTAGFPNGIPQATAKVIQSG